MSMSDEQKRRYARHIVLPHIGEAGQLKLLSSSVLIVGVGGLGVSTATALAAGGVGKLGLVEPDRVELSNLQRQTLYETADIGQYKADAAEARLSELNPDVVIEKYITRLDETNVGELIAPYDLVIDGSDNYATRYILNDTCMRLKKPWVYGAMLGFAAQISLFKPHAGNGCPCYRCLVPEQPERERSCAQEGIVGPLAAVAGGLQALAAMNEIVGSPETLAGHMLLIDGFSMDMRRATLPRDPACQHAV